MAKYQRQMATSEVRTFKRVYYEADHDEYDRAPDVDTDRSTKRVVTRAWWDGASTLILEQARQIREASAEQIKPKLSADDVDLRKQLCMPRYPEVDVVPAVIVLRSEAEAIRYAVAYHDDACKTLGIDLARTRAA